MIRLAAICFREALFAYIVAHHAAPEGENTYCQWPRSAA